MTITITQDNSSVHVDADSLRALTERITDLIVRAARWVDHDSDEDRGKLAEDLYNFVNEDLDFAALAEAAEQAGKPAAIKSKPAFCMTTDISFLADLEADEAAGKIRHFCRFAAKDECTGAEAVVVWLPDGTQAIADGTRFDQSDWEQCGRLEVHTPDPDDELDEMALLQAE